MYLLPQSANWTTTRKGVRQNQFDFQSLFLTLWWKIVLEKSNVNKHAQIIFYQIWNWVNKKGELKTPIMICCLDILCIILIFLWVILISKDHVVYFIHFIPFTMPDVIFLTLACAILISSPINCWKQSTYCFRTTGGTCATFKISSIK